MGIPAFFQTEFSLAAVIKIQVGSVFVDERADDSHGIYANGILARDNSNGDHEKT
jgi:hypothetical protein